MSSDGEAKSIYIQFGCGFSAGDGWLNFDSSPTLRIERVPLLGSLLSSCFSGNVRRFPASVRYGDICKGLPVADGAAFGVYASHVLEHLSLDDLRRALPNIYKMLAPGGIFRLIVPDLQERAKRYVDQAARHSADAALIFMRTTHLGQEQRPKTLVQHIRHMIGGSKHLWMWDESSMTAELNRAGFVDIRRCELGDAADPMFSRVEEPSRFFDEEFKIRECALEARRPAR